MTKDTIRITNDLPPQEENDICVEYYTLDGKKPKLYMCPGDLIVICNVLNDYCDLLRHVSTIIPETESGTQMIYDVHAERCKKIQSKIERQIGYSTEVAIEKCRKKSRRKKADDVGEDALVLALKHRVKKEKDNSLNNEKNLNKDQRKEDIKKDPDMNQISLFDFLEA